MTSVLYLCMVTTMVGQICFAMMYRFWHKPVTTMGSRSNTRNWGPACCHLQVCAAGRPVPSQPLDSPHPLPLVLPRLLPLARTPADGRLRDPRACAATLAAPLLPLPPCCGVAAPTGGVLAGGRGLPADWVYVSHCGDAGCVLKARQQLGGTLRVHHTRALSSRSSWRIGFRAEAWRRRRVPRLEPHCV